MDPMEKTNPPPYDVAIEDKHSYNNSPVPMSGVTYAPQQAVYPPQQAVYPPQQTVYSPQQAVYPPPLTGYIQQGQPVIYQQPVPGTSSTMVTVNPNQIVPAGACPVCRTNNWSSHFGFWSWLCLCCCGIPLFFIMKDKKCNSCGFTKNYYKTSTRVISVICFMLLGALIAFFQIRSALKQVERSHTTYSVRY